MPTITPPQISSTRRCKFVDALLRLGKRRADRDRRHSRGEGPDPVLDAVDRGAGVAIVELRQHDFAWARRRWQAVDAGGAHQTSVRGRLVDGRRSGQSRSRMLMSPRLLTESSRRSSWLYWSLVTPNPDPRAESDDQSNHRERRDDDDDAQRQHARQQQVQALAAVH